MSEAELEYYYYGLHRMLRRYRTMTLLGWAFVTAGFLSVVIGWRYSTLQGLTDVLLSCLTIAAGVALVFQSVASLEAYVQVPVQLLQGKTSDDQASEVVREIMNIISDIDRGGWQEAYVAIQKLRDLGAAHGLPSLPHW